MELKFGFKAIELGGAPYLYIQWISHGHRMKIIRTHKIMSHGMI